MAFTLYMIGANFDLFRGTYKMFHSWGEKVLPHINKKTGYNTHRDIFFESLDWYKIPESKQYTKAEIALGALSHLQKGDELKKFYHKTYANRNASLDNKVFFFDGGGSPDSSKGGLTKHDTGRQESYDLQATTGTYLEEEIELEGTIYLKGNPSSLEHIKRQNAFLAVKDGRLYTNGKKLDLDFFGFNPRYLDIYSFSKK